jgi:uncharacterized protein (TIGR03067 family)
LDHLRRQAKSLLADVAAGDPEAAAIVRRHLPGASRMTAEQVRATGFRLADAQFAVARQSGFASWPRLARHVEQLRALEGAWAFASLEIDASRVPPEGLAASRLLIDGDRFRTESPEAIYEGVFNIDVETDPHGIDIEFVAGPEAGNWNYGIFRLDADRLDICLDMTGKGRPASFRTSPGSGHAYEILQRASRGRPEAVTGGTPPDRQQSPPPPGNAATGCEPWAPPQAEALAAPDPREFEYVPSPALARLQGEWKAEKLVRNGEPLPPTILATARRSAKDNRIRITVGGQLIIEALVRIDDAADPIRIDYYHLGGMTKGVIQHGIMEWRGETACFCMGAPGQPRPADFECPAGSSRTLSHWRQMR